MKSFKQFLYESFDDDIHHKITDLLNLRSAAKIPGQNQNTTFGLDMDGSVSKFITSSYHSGNYYHPGVDERIPSDKISITTNQKENGIAGFEIRVPGIPSMFRGINNSSRMTVARGLIHPDGQIEHHPLTPLYDSHFVGSMDKEAVHGLLQDHMNLKIKHPYDGNKIFTIGEVHKIPTIKSQ